MPWPPLDPSWSPSWLLVSGVHPIEANHWSTRQTRPLWPVIPSKRRHGRSVFAPVQPAESRKTSEPTIQRRDVAHALAGQLWTKDASSAPPLATMKPAAIAVIWNPAKQPTEILQPPMPECSQVGHAHLRDLPHQVPGTSVSSVRSHQFQRAFLLAALL